MAFLLIHQDCEVGSGEQEGQWGAWYCYKQGWAAAKTLGYYQRVTTKAKHSITGAAMKKANLIPVMTGTDLNQT